MAFAPPFQERHLSSDMIRTCLRPAILAVLLALPAFSASAQQGRVIYDETVQIEINLPPEMESMRDQIPSSRTNRRMLLFTESGHVMRDAPEEEGEEDEGSTHRMAAGAAAVEIRMMGRGDQAENIVHTDLDAWTTVEQRDFMGRTFLITGEPTEYRWRLTSERGTYKGYETQKAVTTVDSSEVIAWFTPQIPVSAGPDGYGGLPGLILVMDINDGRRVYSASDIELDAVFADDEYVVPTKGKKVSREEFDEIVDEKLKEMGAQRGRGGNMVIRMGN